MSLKVNRALFLFRRDLRLDDNTGLLFALKQAKEVVLAFIFTPEQIERNPYRSDHCLQFMIESLEDLEEQIHEKKGKLYIFNGKPEQVVEKCIRTLKIDGVVVNRDYTPYSILRDEKIEKMCIKHNVPFHSFDDALLHSFDETHKSDGNPYTIFTPFYRNADRLEIRKPLRNPHTHYFSGKVAFAKAHSFYKTLLPKRFPQQKGGRAAALGILKKMSAFSSYKQVRDFPFQDATTHLSAHLKFTTCSPREIYYAAVSHFGKKADLVRSLYWRDFFTSIAWHFPHVFKGAFRAKFNKISWSYDKKAFKRWCDGKTGCPIVDAGMREMNQTGFMHNRVRMIAASFLVKDLHIDWRWGEKYFAQTLIDYDPAVNNGNWQWVASTGCDAQPYFRIFNPWAQAEKFDPECLYIKRWVPELDSLTSKAIHHWYVDEQRDRSIKYPAPLVDHAEEAKAALSAYRKCI
jgi:deoxyribodipyrimidine photo-lyase